jgi:hypothetical protein
MLGSGFRPLTRPVHYERKEKKDHNSNAHHQQQQDHRMSDLSSLMRPTTTPDFSAGDIIFASSSPLTEPEIASYFKLGNSIPSTPSSSGGSSYKDSLEAFITDSSPLSPEKLHHLLTGSSNLISSHSHGSGASNSGNSGTNVLQQLFSSNPFPTHPLTIFDPMQESDHQVTISEDQLQHVHDLHHHSHQPNLTFSSSNSGGSTHLIHPTANSFVYETVTISHPSSPFSPDSLSSSSSSSSTSDSSHSNPPAFLTGFRQYPTSAPIPHQLHHPLSFHPPSPHASASSSSSSSSSLSQNHRRPPAAAAAAVVVPSGINSMMTHIFPSQIHQQHRLVPSLPINKIMNKLRHHPDNKPQHGYIYLSSPHAVVHNPPQSLQQQSVDHMIHPQASVQHVVHSHKQVSNPNHLVNEFNQLPAAIQAQIAQHLGLVVPKTTPKYVSQSSASGAAYEENASSASSSEEGDDTPSGVKTKHVFGLPSLKPVKVSKPDPPKHNFHTQNPNLLPNPNLMMTSGSQMRPVNADGVKVMMKPMQQNRFPVQHHQHAAAIPNSLMSEINNLLKQTIFTRPRSLSMRYPPPPPANAVTFPDQFHPHNQQTKSVNPLPAGAGNQFPLKMTPNSRHH